jgi:Periplasmic protein involved in polysaccharide export
MGDEIYIYSKAMITGLTEFGNVSIEGYVKRPGEYTFFKNMTLKDLLFKAGGIDDFVHRKSMIFNRIDIIRINEDFSTKKLINVDISKKHGVGNSDGYYNLQENDKVIVYSEKMFEEIPYVTISGSIINPGMYELKDEMTLNDLILEAGGVADRLKTFKAEITRKNEKNKRNNATVYSEIFEFQFSNTKNDLVQIFDEKSRLTYLKPFDEVIIRPDPYAYKNRNVSISGYVLYPGIYPLSSSDDKITDIIERAGGLTYEAYPKSSRLIRDSIEVKVSFEKIINNSRSKYNFNVYDGDQIVI